MQVRILPGVPSFGVWPNGKALAFGRITLMKLCGKCKVPKPPEDFSMRTFSSGNSGRQAWCKECHKRNDREYYKGNAKRRADIAHRREITAKGFRGFVDSFKNVRCADCDHKFPTVCMDFDHVRGEKLYEVSDMKGHSQETIQKEIDKCDVVCSNCHRIRTHNRLGRSSIRQSG